MEYLPLDKYWSIARRIIMKYAPVLINDDANIGEVVEYMIKADTKFNGDGDRDMFRVYYGKFAVSTLLYKRKKLSGKKYKTFSLDRIQSSNNDKTFAEDIPSRETNVSPDMKRLLNDFCPEQYKETMLDYYINGNTTYELAKKYNISHQAITVRINYSLAKIKEGINEHKLTANDFID